MTPEELEQLVSLGERKHIEFKSGKPFSEYREKIVKGVMALANNRGGGKFIIGVEDGGEITGLSPEQLKTYHGDVVIEQVNKHVNPFVRLETEFIEHNKGTCVCIHVYEFHDVPIICFKQMQKDNKQILRKGAVYVRSERKPESIAVEHLSDMRSLVDLATQKGVERVLNMVGQHIVSSKRKLVEIDETPKVKQITTGCYFHLRVWPSAESDVQIDYSSLEKVISESSVRNHSFPPYCIGAELTRGVNGISRTLEGFHRSEWWRLLTTGQFDLIMEIKDSNYPDKEILNVGWVVYLLALSFEFTSLLVRHPVFTSGFRGHFEFHGLKDRVLFAGVRRYPFAVQYKATIPSWGSDFNEEILIDTRAKIKEEARQLFARFGWTASPSILDSWVDEVGVW